ncbi:hypothetical protein OK016_29310 [Vibrio chagasii]|nr:hypothetical protein [Vibrio chagasii]
MLAESISPILDELSSALKQYALKSANPEELEGIVKVALSPPYLLSSLLGNL